jgi:hypothetical protein
MPHQFWKLTAFVLVLCWSVGLLAADAVVGVVKVLRGTVAIERAGSELSVALGTVIRETDQIVTGADGAIGITFQDNSLLSLGPNSRLAVERFNFDSTTHDGEFQTSLKQGKLAVISGKIAKRKEDAMRVRTPASIIGVRGTEFVVEVVAGR